MNLTKQKQSKQAEIVPDISLMKKMASISGTIASRIMELVDNSIDARVEGQQLQVDINISNKKNKEYIEIVDNGIGMTELTARTFFRLGDSQKEGQHKIGRFGLGSKVAILGIGDTCKVETSPIGENYKVKINFDIHQFKDWKINYNIQKEEKETHGTKIRIENVTIRIGNLDKFCEKIMEHVARTYKNFLKNNEIVIRVNGQEVNPYQVELIPGLVQKFDFEVNGKRVYGWAGAMKKAGTNWDFGFDLINNGRVIKGRDLLHRQAHTSLARLTGEIHLDDFATDVHKTDFIRHDPTFEEMQDVLINVVLKDLISKVAKLTNKEVFSKYEKDIIGVSKQLNRIINNIDFLNNIEIDEGIFKKIKSNVRTLKATTKEEKDLMAILDELFKEKKEKKEKSPRKPRNRKAGLLIEEPIPVSNGEDQPLKRWFVDEKDDGFHLSIQVNIDHPAYQSDDERDVLSFMKSTVVDSVAEFVLQEEKRHTGFVDDEVERLNKIKDLLVRFSLK